MKSMLTNWLKAGLVITGLLGYARPAHADLDVSIGDLNLQVPFAETEVVSLYDVIGKKGFAGLETPVAKYRTIEASIGAVSDVELRGMPFLGVRREVKAGLFKDSFYIGVWLGRDFRSNVYRGGIKASKPLWGGAPRE
jgi:hypothetical protein